MTTELLVQALELTGVQARALVDKYRAVEFDRVFDRGSDNLAECELMLNRAGRAQERDELFVAACHAAAELCQAEPLLEDVLYEQATATIARSAGADDRCVRYVTRYWDEVVQAR